MDRLTQLRGEAGGSRDSTLDTSAPPSETYLTANDSSSSKFYSLTEDDSTFDITPIKDVSLASAADPEKTAETDELMSMSPIPKKNEMLDSYKIGKQIEAANILSGGVDIFDDNDNSYDGNELVIDDNVVEIEEKSNPELKADDTENTLVDSETIASKDTEVVLQIDGKNVNAIDIGNGLYLYRKDGEEELAAVQIVDDNRQQPSFKFLKVRENVEGNLEVYEEIEIEVPKEVPAKEGKTSEKNALHVPIKDINKMINDPICNKVADRIIKPPETEQEPTTSTTEYLEVETKIETQAEPKSEANLNGKMMKFNETRKSPFIHSTPNKEGIPLTKTMVDLQLHPNRHSDNVKTIEVHTDKQKLGDKNIKSKDLSEDNKSSEIVPIEKEQSTGKLETVTENRNPQETEESARMQLEIEKKKDHLEIEKDSGNTETSAEEKSKSNKTSDLDIIVTEIIDDTSLSEKEVKIEETVSNQDNTKCNHPEGEKIEENYKTENLNVVGNDNTYPKEVVKDILSLREIATSKSTSSKEGAMNIGEVDDKILDDKGGDQIYESIDQQKQILEENEVETKCNKDSASPTPKIIDTEIQEVTKQSTKVEDVDNAIKIPSENKSKATTDSEQLNVQLPESSDAINFPAPATVPTKSEAINVEKSNTDQSVPKTVSAEKTISVLIQKERERQSSNPVTIKKLAIANETIINLDSKPEVTKNKIELINVPVGDLSKSRDLDCKPKILTMDSVKSVEVLVESKDLDTKPDISIKDNNEPINVDNAIKGGDVKLNKIEKTDNQQIPLTPPPLQPTIAQNKADVKKEITNSKSMEQKPINNNHAAVPFGMWTEANRQEFLNKIKETKVPTSNTNTKQIKQPKDLNRRDVLQKIDSQRQSNNAVGKNLELSATHKANVKNETKTFINKTSVSQDSKATASQESKVTVTQESKVPVKTETITMKNKIAPNKKVTKQEINKTLKDLPNTVFTTSELPNTTFSTSSLPDTTFSTSIVTISKKETIQRKEINNQDLIDKTIEGIINRAPSAKTVQEDIKQTVVKETIKIQKDSSSYSLAYQTKENPLPTPLDAIEMKMNELHGIPFVERPPHELPHVYNHDVKTFTKQENSNAAINLSKIPNLVPITNTNQPIIAEEGVVEVDSEEEIIEYEPVTGDIEILEKNVKSPTKLSESDVSAPIVMDSTKKEPIITEKDFDKFARRNSITYENCLTVNFEDNQPHNVIQTIIEKDIPVKKYSRNELLLAEAKKTSQKHHALHPNKHSSKIHITSKLMPVNDDALNKNYHSKLQIAYQSALTAKRKKESPITIIEDKPVKVVFMDAPSEYVPSQLNVQGKELSPAKKLITEPDILTVNSCDSLDSDIMETIDVGKFQDDSKIKSKHQRKQVLTPVETPELELIEPKDLGIQLSPKKKRKTEDIDRTAKALVPKKSYLLGRSTIIEDKIPAPQDLTKNPLQDTINQSNPIVSHKPSPIDNLVKAAELIENQSEILNTATVSNINLDSQQNTPVKRGRGRPRKYPLPDGVIDKTKVTPATPQKKPRLMDAKNPKHVSDTEDDTEDTTDDEVIKENWTMGKINEKIVCPICNKLFRSENVVFKHVKHCTGPSPNRSDSDQRSPRISRQSRESESKFRESKSEDTEIELERSSLQRDKRGSKEYALEPNAVKDDIVLIEDSPAIEKLERTEPKPYESRKKAIKMKLLHHASNNLACEICGKTFRQSSYLASHKLQHNKGDTKKTESDFQSDKSVFSCEVCKKKFRKLHHLAQHRPVHNPSGTSSRPSRKSSFEQSDSKVVKDNDSYKSDDQSAAFRCEPCDKSFRKLHHLVEHRETHEQAGQKINSTPTSVVDKPTPVPPPQCNICKKTFRKPHHLSEHKEQHHEKTNSEKSEKSDDKSVKSALSTKDIIHECSLCYMVFPNEHSLNKHSIICQRKKRQSAAKQPKPTEENEINEDSNEISKDEETKFEDKPSTAETEIKVETEITQQNPQITTATSSAEIMEDLATVTTKLQSNYIETEMILAKPAPNKRDSVKSDDSDFKLADIASDIPIKIKKNEEKSKEEVEIFIKVSDKPKRKSSVKDKVAPTVTKRRRSSNPPVPIIDENSATVMSSDDEEVRYMLNPDYKFDESSEGKLFMKVRAKKRNSLQIERPNSKELVKRRTSLQHPPKIPRVKPKAVVTKITSTLTASLKNAPKLTKSEPVSFTDSDDSDIKYSFPKTVTEKPASKQQQPTSKDTARTPKGKRKSVADKRKSLGGVTKRKSIAKPVITKHKAQAKPSLLNQIKRRIAEVEHRCDCGQLFSSAALLSRHTTLAHTPPRIRRRRSPPPEAKPIAKTTPRKTPDKPKPAASRKSSTKSDASNTKSTQKSLPKSEPKTPGRKPKNKNDTKSTTVKARRSAAHRGVPVPEKMRKLFEKAKK